MLLILAGLLGVGAVIQGARRWRQGDRMASLIPLGVCIAVLLVWLAGTLIAPHMD